MFSVLGIVVLGAISNGVWESLLRPALHTGSRWVLDIASFSVTNYKNGVYQQVAADDQSWFALETLVRVTIMYALISAALIFFFMDMFNSLRLRAQSLFDEFQGAPSDRENDFNLESAKKEVADVLKSVRRARVFVYSYSIILGLIFVDHFMQIAKRSYVSSADAHYHHVLRVASPYLNSGEQVEVESDFAQIGSRDDYVKVLSRLESLCKAHGRTVPKFDPW
jgi:hypothetical protein